jgi:hypothetical protein
MNGIYCNEAPNSKPFLFAKGGLNNFSVRLSVFTYSKVGKWVPSDFEGNRMISPECIMWWQE